MLFKNNPELLLYLKKLIVVLQYHQISIQSVLKISNLSYKFHSFYTVWSLESKSDKVYVWFLYMSQVFLTYGFPLDYFQKMVFFFLFSFFNFFLAIEKILFVVSDFPPFGFLFRAYILIILV